VVESVAGGTGSCRGNDTFSCDQCEDFPADPCILAPFCLDNVRPKPGGKKRVVSFSLFKHATDKWKVFSWGLLHNIVAARTVYPGWKVRVYVDQTVPTDMVKLLQELPEVEVEHRERKQPWDGISWRFEVADDPDVEFFATRDADSRVCWREAMAMREFMESDFSVHAMHDHPITHGYGHPINAGMFGGRGQLTVKKMGKTMKQLWEQYHSQNYADRVTDQNFLRDIIWPQFSQDALVHVDYSIPYCGNGVHCKKFGPIDPNLMVGGYPNYFVGRVFPAEETTLCGCRHGKYARWEVYHEFQINKLFSETFGRLPTEAEAGFFT